MARFVLDHKAALVFWRAVDLICCRADGEEVEVDDPAVAAMLRALADAAVAVAGGRPLSEVVAEGA